MFLEGCFHHGTLTSLFGDPWISLMMYSDFPQTKFVIIYDFIQL